MFQWKYFLTLLGATLIGISSYSQDLHFSQFYNSPLNLNPALAGAFDGSMRGVLNYKNQWGSIDNMKPFQTLGASFDMSFLKDKWSNGYIAGGLSFIGDKAGTANYGNTKANLSITSHVYLSKKHTLSAGLLAGYGQWSVDYNQLKWPSQYDGTNYDKNMPTREPPHQSSFGYPDIGAGVQWNYGKKAMYATANDQLSINAGVSMFHINRPNTSFYQETPKDRLHYKFNMHAGSFIGIPNTNTAVNPSVLFSKQGPHSELIAGAKARYKLKQESKYTGFVKGAAASLGGYYRFGDALIIQTYFEMSGFGLGLSYDITLSRLTTINSAQGGFEMSFRYIFNPDRGKSQAAPRL